jgi:hypothetical protein
MKVGGAMQRDDKDAFALVAISLSEVRDLDFCNDCARELNVYIGKVKTSR